MGEYLRETGRRLTEGRDRPSGSPRVSRLVLAYALVAVGSGVAAAVRPSALAGVGAVLIALAAWSWAASDRAERTPEHGSPAWLGDNPALKLAALSLVTVIVGFFTALTGLIKAW